MLPATRGRGLAARRLEPESGAKNPNRTAKKKTRFITGAKERTENYNIIFDSAGTRRVNEPHFGLLKLAATWQRVGRADTILAPCSLLAAPAMQWHFFCFSYSTIPAISMTQGLRGIQRYLQSQTKRKVTIS